MSRVLLTGIRGQIGSYLLPRLMTKYGASNIIASDVSDKLNMGDIDSQINYLKLDVTDNSRMEEIIKSERITEVIHLASILSALGEKYPELAKRVNIDAVVNVLDLAKKYNLK